MRIRSLSQKFGLEWNVQHSFELDFHQRMFLLPHQIFEPVENLHAQLCILHSLKRFPIINSIGFLNMFLSNHIQLYINLSIPMIEVLALEFSQLLSPLVVFDQKEITGIDTAKIKHDYFTSWEKTLNKK